MINQPKQRLLREVFEGLEDIYRRINQKDVVLFGEDDRTYTPHHVAELIASLPFLPCNSEDGRSLELTARSYNLQAGKNILPLGILYVRINSSMKGEFIQVVYNTKKGCAEFRIDVEDPIPIDPETEENLNQALKKYILSGLEKVIA